MTVLPRPTPPPPLFPVPQGRDLHSDTGAGHTIEAWVVVDGVRVYCTPEDLGAGQPTVLDGLSFQWGRDTNVDQPDVGSCSFTIREQLGVAGEQTNRVSDAGFADPDMNTARFPADWSVDTGVVTVGVSYSNLAYDPSFGEQAGITAGGSAAVYVQSGVNGVTALYGSTALTIAQNASGTDTTLQYPTAYVINSGGERIVDFQPSHTYNISVYCRVEPGTFTDTNTAARTITVRHDLDDGTQIWDTPSGQAAGDSEWHRISTVITVPTNATKTSIRLVSNTIGAAATTGAKIRTIWDGLQVTEGAGLHSYTDDENPPTGSADSYRVWLIGNRKASTSTAGPSGTAPGNGAIPVTPGQMWRFNIDARATVSREVRWQVQTYDASGAGFGGSRYVAANTKLPAGQWAQVPGEFTVPDGAAYMAVAFVPEGGFGGTVDITNPTVTQTSKSTLDMIHIGSQVEVWTRAIMETTLGQITTTVILWIGEVVGLRTQAAGYKAVTTAVEASDLSAILQNSRVGDEPWPAETVQARADKIMALIPTAPPLHIDTGLQDTTVSYRDVDAQAPFDLLTDLAQTAGGVLWITANPDDGAYLWMEDPTNRSAVRRFAIDEAGAVYISDGQGGSIDGVSVLSANDVLRDPVTWTQDVSQVITQATVNWMEQVTDADGEPTTEERAVIVQDTADIVAKYGVRNIDVGTELTTEADASDLAARVLAMSRGTGWRIEGLHIDTGVLERPINIDTHTRLLVILDLLDATTRIGYPITLVDMPEWTPEGAVRSVYVDGGTYTWADHRWQMELTATPSAGQGRSATWADFAGTGVTWDDFRTHKITWADAYGTAGPLTTQDQEDGSV